MDLRVEEETPPTVVEPPELPSGRQAVIADHEFDLAHRQAEGFGRHLGHDGAGAGAQILRADFDHHGAIGIDGGAALCWRGPRRPRC